MIRNYGAYAPRGPSLGAQVVSRLRDMGLDVEALSILDLADKSDPTSCGISLRWRVDGKPLEVVMNRRELDNDPITATVKAVADATISSLLAST